MLCLRKKSSSLLSLMSWYPTQYPSTKLNSLAVSKRIKEAFPNTESKPIGKANLRYVFGLQEQEPVQCSSTIQPSREESLLMLEQEKNRNRELESKLNHSKKSEITLICHQPAMHSQSWPSPLSHAGNPCPLSPASEVESK